MRHKQPSPPLCCIFCTGWLSGTVQISETILVAFTARFVEVGVNHDSALT